MFYEGWSSIIYHFSLWHILSIGFLIRTFLCFFNIFVFLLESKSFCPSSFSLTSLLAEWKHKPYYYYTKLTMIHLLRKGALKDKITSKVLSFVGTSATPLLQAEKSRSTLSQHLQGTRLTAFQTFPGPLKSLGSFLFTLVHLQFLFKTWCLDSMTCNQFLAPTHSMQLTIWKHGRGNMF